MSDEKNLLTAGLLFYSQIILRKHQTKYAKGL